MEYSKLGNTSIAVACLLELISKVAFPLKKAIKKATFETIGVRLDPLGA